MPASPGEDSLPALPVPAPGAPVRVFYVRHGVTDYNAAGRIQGHRDVPLNGEGRRQAEAVARRLAAAGIQRLVSSDLARARATAEAIARVTGLPCRLDPALRERNLGSWSGLSRAGPAGAGAPAAALPGEQAARSMSVWSAPPGGEAYAEMALRVTRALARLVEAHPGEVLAVVSHGGPIRAAVAAALGMPLSARGRLELDNASLTIVRYGPGALVTVDRLNDTCHLDAGAVAFDSRGLPSLRRMIRSDGT